MILFYFILLLFKLSETRLESELLRINSLLKNWSQTLEELKELINFASVVTEF